MSVRQYIGARYVPLLIGEWSDTVTYEPLSIVQYQGNSFTSRQFVPIGIDISNEEYWAATGNYNAQIEAYRQEVAAYDGRIDALENGLPVSDFDSTHTVKDAIDDISALLPDTDFDSTHTVKDAIDGISALLPDTDFDSTHTVKDAIDGEAAARIAADNALDARIDNLNIVENPYAYFDGYNCVIIGDSYAYGTGASDHLSGDTKRFSTILCNLLGATEFNYSVGSTGFCDPGSGGENAPFSTQVNTAIAGMTNTQIANTHLVIIAGGVNDFNEGATYTWSDMSNAAATACSRASVGFPNALVLVVPMLFKGHDANPRLLNFEDAIINGINGTTTGHKRCVSIRGAWTWNFGIESRFTSDELHMNDIGHRNIANRIYSNIFGGDAYENQLIIPAWESGFGSSVAKGGYFEMYNGHVLMYGNCIEGTLTANDAIKIGAVPQIAPNEPMYGIIAKANNIVGTWQITQAGNIYCTATENVTDFYMSPLSWVPKGILA